MNEFSDLILTNGRIKTSSGWSEAMAIRGGIIEVTGSSVDIAKRRGPKTQVIDLAGDTVLPGLHDVHVHPIYGGIRERQCRIPQDSNMKEMLAHLKAYVDKMPPGAWVLGGQWEASALGQVPHRRILDALAPENPVLLEDVSAHSSWANSKALQVAGVTRDTPNPPGGIFERDPDGEPTGIQRETAAEFLDSIVPKPTKQEVQSALEWSVRQMASYGITSFTEAAVGITGGTTAELEAYATLADTGVLKQRARLCLVWRSGDEQTEQVIASRNFYARDRISPDCVKIFLDGVPTESHTAAMLEPYQGTVAGRDDEASRYGLLMVKQDVLDQAVTRFDRMGLTVKFHAAGDAAVHAALNSIAAARKANGFSAQIHNVAHCTFVTQADIARARGIQATFEVSPFLWCPTPTNCSISEAVGPELIKRVWPIREMLDAGAHVVPGSDWSVVPSVNPWIGLETLVTRERPGGSEGSFGKSQAITLQEAFDLFTVNSAQQEGVASKLGRIESGMLADIIVVDRNPFEVSITEVHATKVKMTFIGGELVYQSRAA